MGGKIDCYVDIASLYSYLVFLELQKNSALLASHNVEVEFHPVLLGAINAGSGNRPPWTLPAKASYGTHDARRSVARHNPPPPISVPKDLMTAAKTVVPLRCLHYIKQHHPRATFLATLHYLFYLFWAPPNTDLTTVESVSRALAGVPSGFIGPSTFPGAGTGPGAKPGTETGEGTSGGGERLFTEAEARAIVDAARGEEMKAVLKDTTQEALERGAFGAPWLWVSDGRGRAEPFFGSDRFHFVYEFLGLPYRDVTLLPAGGGKGKL
ncbi:glutathione S-transferase kappa 1 [Parachaetomium inaequale]|uniref:Glutathione S-transferase kappa 1 n=1 Tax=Parachaetomium inaequale TaxID=2588326 RepID=A0AAN6PH55_9PEZI|nr:glutathione S-transferase kappa 1 [Parachaetomium inaequale]